jgi:hypothetical protein
MKVTTTTTTPLSNSWQEQQQGQQKPYEINTNANMPFFTYL